MGLDLVKSKKKAILKLTYVNCFEFMKQCANLIIIMTITISHYCLFQILFWLVLSILDENKTSFLDFSGCSCFNNFPRVSPSLAVFTIVTETPFHHWGSPACSSLDLNNVSCLQKDFSALCYWFIPSSVWSLHCLSKFLDTALRWSNFAPFLRIYPDKGRLFHSCPFSWYNSRSALAPLSLLDFPKLNVVSTPRDTWGALRIAFSASFSQIDLNL